MRVSGYGTVTGVYSYVTSNYSAASYGGNIYVTGPTDVYGVKAIASGGSNINYGVYASGGNNCTATSNCAAAGLYCNGALAYTGALVTPSDIMLKTNINDITNATSLLMQLASKSYEYDHAQFPQMQLAEGTQYGLLATDVAALLPQFVKDLIQPIDVDTAGIVLHPQVNYKGISYMPFITLLIAGFKEQQNVIDSLIMALQGQPKQGIGNLNFPPSNKLSIELTNEKAIILNQNDPNPFAENTTISYNIPSAIKTAKLLFYDNTGTVLKTIEIPERGAGSVLAYASNLSKGIYNYTLLIDGTVFETKKMVKH